MNKEIIFTQNAPNPIGPYSQGVVVNSGKLFFTSGQIGLKPNGEMASGIAEQTEVVMQNLEHLLHKAGTSLQEVIKTTIYLQDLNDFATVNEIYGKYFTENPPARSTVQVARLPKEALVEIEIIATCQ